MASYAPPRPFHGALVTIVSPPSMISRCTDPPASMLGLRRVASSAAPAVRGYATTTPRAAKLGVEAMASKVDLNGYATAPRCHPADATPTQPLILILTSVANLPPHPPRLHRRTACPSANVLIRLDLNVPLSKEDGKVP